MPKFEKPKILDKDDLIQVHEFCIKCKKLGYINNSSFEKMKWDDAIWFGHFLNDRIVSLSGVQEFMDGHRIMFRGATLPGFSNKILSIPQGEEQMKYIGKSNFYFTLNCDDAYGSKSNRLRRIINAGKGWPGCVYVKTDVIYGVKQEIWKV